MLYLLFACTSSIELDRKPDGTPVDSSPVQEAELEGLSARLHDTYRSVVYVSWSQSAETEAARVEYSFDEGVWERTPEVAGTAGGHEQIIVGVPYGVALQWRVVLRNGTDEAPADGPTITTEDDPGLPRATVEVADEAGWDPSGRYLLTSVSLETPMVSTRPEFYVVIVDRQGRYVWAHPANPKSWTLFAKPSRSGRNILYDDSLFWTELDGGDDGAIHSLRLDGTVVHEWAAPGLDHGFDDLDDDNVVYTAQESKDDVLYRVAPSGALDPLWACASWLKTTDLDSGGGFGGAACGCNSITWDEVSDSFVMSLWSQEAVVQIDATTSDTIWYAGRDGGGYEIDPDALWGWEHDAQLLPNGHLLLSSGAGDAGGHNDYETTAVYEYAINADTQSLDLVWSFVGESSWHARYKGGASRLAGGNTVHYYGSHPGVREITPGGAVVWQMEFADGSWIGRSTWLDDLYTFVGDAAPVTSN